ncbi:hypothetical protein [Mangrovicoccus sp. HB161399]|uniref:hypothetical protein n=1 Tax=Mangrovicoccus sp. HB161399 TaxID=2720392 RepID=UPI001554A626|nr:hypothetical protein [Mangrovicoccus sp. HB161399]
MYVLADTARLVADGVLSPAQAEEMERRARSSMIELAAGLLLSFGILAAAGGVIFWLRDALTVAVMGCLAVGGGLALRAWAPRILQLFATAAVLTGAGMLLGGTAAELLWNRPALAGPVMVPLGAATALFCGWRLFRRPDGHFAAAAILLMGLAMHLGGLWRMLVAAQETGSALPFALLATLFWLHAFAAIALAGRAADLRAVTALAILPFSQIPALDLGRLGSEHVFALDDPTLAILQLALLAALCLAAVPRLGPAGARHAAVLAGAAFVMANLCAFAGSMGGDVIGSVWFEPQRADFAGDASYEAARQAWLAGARTIPEGAYSLLWAAALAVLIPWSAVTLRRGIFNAAVAFAVLHAYAQIFERLDGEPLAFVIAGLAAFPLAWAARMANRWLAGQARSGG